MHIHLPFVPGQLAKDFARFREAHKGKVLKLVVTFYDAAKPAEEQEIDSVCSDFIKGTRSEPMIPEAADINAEMRAAISVPYLRAIAKIGFHFVLAHFPFTGMEPQFDGIKQFIFTGDHHEQFVQSMQEPFVEELKDPNALAKCWCHLLSAQYAYNSIEARMQFFTGPKLRPLVWRVMLGPSPSRVVGTFHKGFMYRYFDLPDKEGYTGEMTTLQRAKP